MSLENLLCIEDESKKRYSFQFALTDEVMQKRIVDFISPIKDQWDILNLQLAYGVLEKENNIFITRIKSGETEDEDTGQDYHTTYLVALTKDACFQISYTLSYAISSVREEEGVTYDVPKEYEKVLIPAIDYYRNWKEHKVFERELETQDDNFNMLKLNSELRGPLYDLIPEPEPIVKKHFEIHGVEDAKKLFFLCNTSYYRKLKEQYDEETNEAFTRYADRTQMEAWIIEKCETILKDIIRGDTTKLYKKLCLVSGYCGNWLSNPNDLVELYTGACSILFQSNIYVPIRCIYLYLKKFEKRFNPLRAVKLLDITEDYLKTNYSEEYASSSSSHYIDDLKRTISHLRNQIKGLTPHNFEYVLTKPSILQVIVNWYLRKYKEMETVKEELSRLNCLYGVQNEEMFLTAETDAADDLNSNAYYLFRFIAVIFKNMEVIDFRCGLDMETGKLKMEHRSSENLSPMALDAVNFFRNKLARDAFFEKYASENNGKNLYYQKADAHEALFASLGPSFRHLLNRIGANPLADTLKSFVKLCETIAPEYGFKNIEVYEPATESEIEQWETQNLIKLPESYRNFLKFANGFYIKGCSDYINGLDGIILSCEHIEPEYMIIGSIIGDGTTLCLSKENGMAYIEDHGEYRCYGDFKKLLERVIDLARG